MVVGICGFCVVCVHCEQWVCVVGESRVYVVSCVVRTC